MHAFIPFLNVYTPIALLITIAGLTYRIGIHVVRLSRPPSPGLVTNLLDAPPKLDWLAAIWNVLSFPVTRFNVRANPVLVWGVVLYHVGVITIIAGYALSTLLVCGYLALGLPIPDVSTGISVSYNISYSNVLAVIFGNGEPLQSAFLFGPLAGAFKLLTWLAVISALCGNSLILITHILGRGGAIVGDIDRAAKKIRIKGMFTVSHVLITLVVYTIIWTEILSRIDAVHGIVYLHSVIGITLILMMPYTYLFHMVYFPVSMYYSARRWRERCIA